MADKKEIIIDCINVNECEFYGYEGICKLYSGSVCSKDCSNYPNCNYKQFKRAKQECEKYKQALDEIEKIISTPCISTINSCIECKCSSCLYKQFLNIINKAKESE